MKRKSSDRPRKLEEGLHMLKRRPILPPRSVIRMAGHVLIETDLQQRRPHVELSLWGLLQTYPDIPHHFPLFYYTLNNDLTINSDSVPLIGSIPSTVTPLEKADMLAMYYHRGRRVLAQLDTFTSRCDRKYDGPAEKWHELEYHTRIAVRDVRRKVVERCENYKYTRRDILDK
jgi:hypothetical protein